MKVKVWTEVEVTADVSSEEMLAELAKLPYSERLTSMLAAINTACGVLRRVPDESIAAMNDAQREIVAGALSHEVERYLISKKGGG